jgi:hypothetical protein
MLVLGLVVIYYTCGKVTVHPVIVGKLATVLQMVCVVWGLMKWPADWLMAWSVGAAGCTGLSGVIYLYQGIRQLSASPTSAPTPKAPGAS